MQTQLVLQCGLTDSGNSRGACTKWPWIDSFRHFLLWRACYAATFSPKTKRILRSPLRTPFARSKAGRCRVDDRLLQPPREEMGVRVLKALERKLADINAVVRPDRLEKLHAVTIQLDMSHGKLHAMQYHPDAEWLIANGYVRALVHCVHIPVAAELLEPRQINVQPWCVMHELAHCLSRPGPRLR